MTCCRALWSTSFSLCSKVVTRSCVRPLRTDFHAACFKRDLSVETSISATPSALDSVVNVPIPPLLHLSDLRDNPGARKKKVRIGRGVGSGCGKTSGRGQKGQRARNSVPLGFEGGQTPLHKRLPKINRHDPFARELEYVTLGKIQRMIDIGRIDSTQRITMRELVHSGCIDKVKHGVILKETGCVGAALDIEVTETTPEAARLVIEAGGCVTLAWYNRLGLRVLVKPKKWIKAGLPFPAWARPPPKFQHRYPDRTESNLPVRVIRSVDDIAAMESAWMKFIHPRARKTIL